MELPGPEVTAALVAELPKAPAERQGLLILALADRGEPRVLPAVLQAAQSGDGQLRILALRALKRVGDASCVPALLDAAVGRQRRRVASRDGIDRKPARQGRRRSGCAARLSQAQGKMRIVLIELASRRRTAAAAPALWLAADDADPAVRAAALAGLGAVIETADLPKLIARLATPRTNGRRPPWTRHCARSACVRRIGKPSPRKLAAALPTAGGPVKARILETLNVVGGTKSLEAVAAAARSERRGTS